MCYSVGNLLVRTPDTDVFVIHPPPINRSVHLDHSVYDLDTEASAPADICELRDSLGEEYCATHLGWYVFGAEDCTGAFERE